MCVYFSKAEDETSEASKTEFETMKAIAKAYSTRENVLFKRLLMMFYQNFGYEKYFQK